MMLAMGDLTAKQVELASQITACTFRATVILNDLLDFTRLQLGSEVPVAREAFDMGSLTGQMVAEMRALYPGRNITVEVSGDTVGEWDKSRMGQVISNLVGNAISHGFPDTAVKVTVKGFSQEVVVSVQNQGNPIPADKIARIFDSLVRGDLHTGDSSSPHSGWDFTLQKNNFGSWRNC